MTTLSKEDVVRALEALESMDDFARMDTGVDPIGPYQVLREFIAARADLVAENERLNELVSTREDDVRCEQNWVRHWHSEAETLRTALAAAEAREGKLRAAIDVVLSDAEECEDHDGWLANLVSCEAIHQLDEAFSQPRDDSALRRLLAEAKAGVYEECISIVKDFHNTSEYPGFAVCIESIHTLAEKAKEEAC